MELTLMIAKLYIYLVFLIAIGRVLDFFPALASLHIGKIVLGSALVYVIALRSASLPRLIRQNPFSPHLGVILATACIGLPFSLWPGGSVQSVVDFLKTLACFVIICGLAGDDAGKSAWRAAILTTGLMAAMMLLAKGTGRISVSSTYDPNDIALFFVTFMPFAAAEAAAGRGLMRFLAAGTAVAAVISIALTQSRGGIIALAAIGLHVLLLVKNRRVLLLLPLLGLGAALVLFSADEALWERFRSLQNESDYNLEDQGGRLEVWKQGIGFFLRRPLTGVGMGQFSTALGTVGSGLYKNAHNSYVQIAAELGLAGIGAFLAMLWKARRMALAAMRQPFASREDSLRHTGLLLGLTGFAVGGFFLSQAYGGILYALLAVFAVRAIAPDAAAGFVPAIARLSGTPDRSPHAPMPLGAPPDQNADLSTDASVEEKSARPQAGLLRRHRKPLPPAALWGNPTFLSRVAAADAAREARRRLLEQGQSRNAKPGGRRMP